MTMRRRIVLGAALAAPFAAHAAPQLIAALREGGLTVYMRHAITDRSQFDTGRLGDRAGQRNLSAAGRAQATRLGQAIRALSIPVGAVLASPVFRAADTAELAFGADGYRVEPFLTADDYTPDAALLSANIARTRARLAEAPRSGSDILANDILVGHIVPLGMIIGRSLSQAEFPEGALALFRPGAPTLIGIVPAEALIAAAP
ncbi:histidine phosphatase family protein [Elioraea sp.]|uniref:histidine phosphatase family protein n=1 Tax=Elioraea sp. TaxID=2185103 RepID=UPI0025BE2E00|nr:histidine phosphatase family protein [Elioraea sp.]